MNVNEILERVVHISHSEDGADSGLRDKALGWLNSAYNELLDEIQPFILDEMAVVVSLAYDSDGIAMLPVDCRRVVAVYEGERSLERLRRAEFEMGEEGYMVTGGRIHVTPCERSSTQTVKVMYVPVTSELVADGEIEMLDAAQHSALIWGALVWGSTYERAFSSQGDLRLFQGKWEDAKRQVKLFYAGNMTLRVDVQSDI